MQDKSFSPIAFRGPSFSTLMNVQITPRPTHIGCQMPKNSQTANEILESTMIVTLLSTITTIKLVFTPRLESGGCFVHLAIIRCQFWTVGFLAGARKVFQSNRAQKKTQQRSKVRSKSWSDFEIILSLFTDPLYVLFKVRRARAGDKI